MTSETVPITEKDIKEYLDKCISFWRDKRDGKVDSTLHEQAAAEFYIDAYQSVRTSLFGETLN